MKFAKDLFLGVAARTATSLNLIAPSRGPSLSMPAPGGNKGPTAEEIIEKNAGKTWFITALCVIVLSAISLGISWFALGNLCAGVSLATFLWAVLFGWFFTFYVHAKIVSAVFGALLSSGTHEIVTGSGFLTATQGYAEKVVKLLSFLPAGSLGTQPDDFIGWMVRIFFGLITLFCLPALFRD